MKKIDFKEKWNYNLTTEDINGKKDSSRINILENTIIKGQPAFIVYSTTGFLIIYNTLTGEEICRSEKLQSDVKEMKLIQIDGNDILVVLLMGHSIEKYLLPDLKKIGESFTLNEYYADNMYIAPFENKMQLFVLIDDSKIHTWDLETGELIHQPLKVYYKDFEIDEDEDEDLEEDLGEDSNENLDENVFLDGDQEFGYKLLNFDNKPLLAINIHMCDNAFLWDLNKMEYINCLDLLDDELREYDDDHTFTYDIYDILPVKINGKDLYLTISTTGIFAFFNSKDLYRVGPIKPTNIPCETFNVFAFNDQQFITIISESTLYLYDLETLDVIKEFSFKQDITAYTISGNTIIIASGEELIAYEMTKSIN